METTPVNSQTVKSGDNHDLVITGRNEMQAVVDQKTNSVATQHIPEQPSTPVFKEDPRMEDMNVIDGYTGSAMTTLSRKVLTAQYTDSASSSITDEVLSGDEYRRTKSLNKENEHGHFTKFSQETRGAKGNLKFRTEQISFQARKSYPDPCSMLVGAVVFGIALFVTALLTDPNSPLRRK